MIIRAADPTDWPAIWLFFAETVAAGETYSYPEDITSDEARAVWMEPPPARTVVAVATATDRAAEQVLGSAKMGPNRPGRGSHIATASFMVAPAARGRGVGRALGLEAVRWARAAGFHGMQFNAVVETNAAAIRLWRSLGFEIIGTVPGAFDSRSHGLVGLHVMFLSFEH